jgi:hypothetical protein
MSITARGKKNTLRCMDHNEEKSPLVEGKTSATLDERRTADAEETLRTAEDHPAAKPLEPEKGPQPVSEYLAEWRALLARGRHGEV